MTEPATPPKQPDQHSVGVSSNDAPASRVALRRSAPLGTAALIVLAVALVSAGLYVSFEAASIQNLERELQSWGPLGVIASLVLMVLHSFVPFPAEFIAIANGMLFGPIVGVAVTWTGAMLGAFAAFGLARRLGRPAVERLVRRKDWDRIDRWTTDQGWKLLLISRLIPVIAFNLVNYAAGLTGVGWLTFAWTTGVGILPATILLVLAGDNIALMGWQVWLLILACVFVLCLVAKRLYSRHERVDAGGERQ